jgi:hypothetical protein
MSSRVDLAVIQQLVSGMILLGCVSVVAAAEQHRQVPIWTLPGKGGAVNCPVVASPCPSAKESGLVFLGELPRSFGDYLAFGDADQDGWNEVYREGVASFEISEHKGANEYETVFLGTSVAPFLVGDFDEDNKHELIGFANSRIEIWESPGIDSFPSVLAWFSEPLSNVVGRALVFDTDQDGKLEILYTENTFAGTASLRIWENVGDDSWVARETLPIAGNAASRDILAGDFDLDSLVEIVVSGISGWIHVFESTADDTWFPAASDSIGLVNAYALAGGTDTDGNGIADLFVEGNTPDQSYLRTIVFEIDSIGGINYVDTLDARTSYIGILHNAVTDLDGDGVFEYLMRTFSASRTYTAITVGEWCFVDSITTTNGPFEVYDLNGNGLPEVYFNSYPVAKTLEASQVSDLVGHTGTTAIYAYPNPSRGYVNLQMINPQPTETIQVYDVRGRLVSRLVLRASPTGYRWNADDLPSGVYLLRLESHNTRPTLRITLRH